MRNRISSSLKYLPVEFLWDFLCEAEECFETDELFGRDDDEWWNSFLIATIQRSWSAPFQTSPYAPLASFSSNFTSLDDNFHAPVVVVVVGGGGGVGEGKPQIDGLKHTL